MGGNYRWELSSRNEYSKGILGAGGSVCPPSHYYIKDEGGY